LGFTNGSIRRGKTSGSGASLSSVRSSKYRAVSGYFRGYSGPTVYRMAGQVILLTETSIANRALRCRRKVKKRDLD
jgi:hypothetical protein